MRNAVDLNISVKFNFAVMQSRTFGRKLTLAMGKILFQSFICNKSFTPEIIGLLMLREMNAIFLI